MKFEKDKTMRHDRLQKRRKDKDNRKGSAFDRIKRIGNNIYGSCPYCRPHISVRICEEEDLEKTYRVILSSGKKLIQIKYFT
jgi:hypothetical protein